MRYVMLALLAGCAGDALNSLPEPPKQPKHQAPHDDPAVDDPPECEAIGCEASVTYDLHGDNSFQGSSTCVATSTPEASDACCEGDCAAAEALLCTPSEEVLASAGLCERLTGCTSGAPSLEVAPDGTPCGTDRTCQDGVCTLDEPEEEPSVGCADDQREGFLDTDAYPNIAACSGAWSFGGLTTATLVPHCDRAGGDDGAHTEGTGCGAEDLCAAGWHVCHGSTEVDDDAPAGCGAAVPPGTPDKALFFAVAQHSVNNSVCDLAAGDNDVFGCGNLGHTLAADKDCGPLNRALASVSAGTCGYNEAEPPLGAWVCQGGTDSHLHEGGLVKKTGCPNDSCSYDGAPQGNSDKGGVLCCRD